MSIEKTLGANEVTKILEAGRYIYLRRAAGAISIILTSDVEQGRSVEVKLRRGEMYDIGEFSPEARFTRLEVRNLTSETNEIELEIGYHRFRPSFDDSDINVTITGSAIDLPVEVVNEVQANITNEVDVHVKSAPDITVKEITSPVTIDSIQNTVEVEQKKQNAIFNPLLGGLYTLDATGSVTIQASDRSQLFIQASTENAGDLLVNDVICIRRGGHLLTPARNLSFTIKGEQDDSFTIGEWISS